MAVRIRLQRFGTKKKPFYRVVASESSRPRDGKFLDIIGTYDPLTSNIKVDKEKIEHWTNNGAKPTDTVRSLFKKYNVLDK